MKTLSVKDYVFTGVQFLLFLVYLFDYDFFEVPQVIPNAILGILTALGVTLCMMALVQLKNNLSPFPSPKENSSLVKTGIFKYIRHPIYTGVFIALLSYALYAQSSSKIVICLLLMILFHFKSNFEEKLLKKKFSEYETYKKRTGKFLPRLRLISTNLKQH